MEMYINANANANVHVNDNVNLDANANVMYVFVYIYPAISIKWLYTLSTPIYDVFVPASQEILGHCDGGTAGSGESSPGPKRLLEPSGCGHRRFLSRWYQ